MESPLERVDSEYECDLMIEALSRELTAIRDHLAFLTHGLHIGPGGDSPSPPHTSRTNKTSSSLQKQLTRRVKLSTEVTEAPPEDDIRLRAHYIGVVDQTETERASARRQYLALMKVHIEQQLIALQRRSVLLKRRLVKREGRIKAAKLKAKPSRQRSSGVDDRSFLGNVYISSFYQIVGEEHRLRREGKIKTPSDLKEFWDSMLQPIVSHTPSPAPQQSLEIEDDEYTSSWALTALPPDREQKTPVRAPTDLYEDKLLEFVPSVPPKLRSVADILDEGRQLTEEVSRAYHGPTEVIAERRRLHKMYQQAKANEMAMRRLLPPSPVFNLSPLSCAHSLTSTQEGHMTMEGSHVIEADDHMTKDASHVSDHLTREKRHVTQTDSHVTKEAGHVTSPVCQAKGPPLFSPPKRHSVSPVRLLVPLTMDSAQEEGTVIMSKGKSSLWTNFITVNR